MCKDGNQITVNDLPGEIVEYESKVLLNDYGEDEIKLSIYVKTRYISINKIRAVLKLVNFNKSKAAKLLGIDRKTLYNRLKSFQYLANMNCSKHGADPSNKPYYNSIN